MAGVIFTKRPKQCEADLIMSGRPGMSFDLPATMAPLRIFMSLPRVTVTPYH
jgi:hypothetical protein